MKVIHENLWDYEEQADIIVVTCNSYVTKETNKLIMGKGAAKEAAVKYPLIPFLAGRKITNSCGHLGRYGFIDLGLIGLFQVKTHFGNKAEIEIIRYSAIRLANWTYAIQNRYNRKLKVHMNFPAIGYGGLPIQYVEPVLENILPSYVTLHCFKQQEEL